MSKRKPSDVSKDLVVSIFDFDGTLFRSPSPTLATEKRIGGALVQPYSNKGLGWFHHKKSLQPPFVPSEVLGIGTSAVVLECLGKLTCSSASNSNTDTKNRIKANETSDDDLEKLVNPNRRRREESDEEGEGEGEGPSKRRASAANFYGSDGLSFLSFQQAYNSYATMTITPSLRAALLENARGGDASNDILRNGVTSSLSLPHDSFDRWFIQPTVVAHAVARRRGDVTAILTGRDEKTFTGRVGSLLQSLSFSHNTNGSGDGDNNKGDDERSSSLQHACTYNNSSNISGSSSSTSPFDYVILKKGSGTVAFKVEVLLRFLRDHTPARLVYYEDRPDQGRKIYKELMKALLACAGGTADAPPSSSSSSCSSSCALDADLARYYYNGSFSASLPTTTGRNGGGGGGGGGTPPPLIEFVYVNKEFVVGDMYLAPSEEAELIAALMADAPKDVVNRISSKV